MYVLGWFLYRRCNTAPHIAPSVCIVATHRLHIVPKIVFSFLAFRRNPPTHNRGFRNSPSPISHHVAFLAFDAIACEFWMVANNNKQPDILRWVSLLEFSRHNLCSYSYSYINPISWFISQVPLKYCARVRVVLRQNGYCQLSNDCIECVAVFFLVAFCVCV